MTGVMDRHPTGTDGRAAAVPVAARSWSPAVVGPAAAGPAPGARALNPGLVSSGAEGPGRTGSFAPTRDGRRTVR
jgi:hypothetical protein